MTDLTELGGRTGIERMHEVSAGSAVSDRVNPCHPCADARAGTPLDHVVAADLPPGELLRAFSEVSPFPLVISREHDGQIVFCNAKLGEMLGLTPVG